MMQLMREKTQGIIAGVIAVLIAVTFALWGVQNYLHGNAAAEPVAKVNGVKITQQDLQVAYEREKRIEMLTAGAGFEFDQKQQARVKEQVLQKLIKTTALINTIKNQGFGVGSQQLNQALTEMPIFQQNGQFSLEKFQIALANLGYSQATFLADLEHNIMFLQLDKGIVTTDFILPSELANVIRLQNQRRDFGYFILKPQHFAATVKVAADEIAKYYNAHKDEFLSPEKISIEYIVLSADKIKQSIHPTTAQLKKYYQDHLASFAAANKKQKAQSYEQVAAKVKMALERQLLQEAFAEQNDKLTDLSYTNSASLTPAATALGLEIKKTNLFTNTGEKSGFLANPKIVKAAFGETTLKQGYNSTPIEISPGEVVVLRVKEHIPEQTLPLEKVRATITAKLAAIAMKQQAAALAKELVVALQQGKDPHALAIKYNLAWLTATNINAQDHNINAEVLKHAFALETPKNKQSFVVAVDLGEQGNAVIQLKDIITPAASTTFAAEQTAKLKTALEHDLGSFDLSLLTDAIMQKATIKLEAKSGSDNTQP